MSTNYMNNYAYCCDLVAGTRYQYLGEAPIPVSHCVKSGYIYFYIEVQVKQVCTQAKSSNDC